jgi:uncharacterized RDD family membrane protein YckC
MNDPNAPGGQQPPQQPPAAPPPPPPQQGWQSTPQQPGPPPMGGGQPGGQPGGAPAWTGNITARGTMAGPGGVAISDMPDRIIAFIIDAIIIGIVGFVIMAILGSVLTETRTDTFLGVPIVVTRPSLIGQIVGVLITLAISAGYFIYMWLKMGGSTIGMRVMKLSVRDAASGGPITQQQAINRWLLLGGPQAAGFLYVLPLIGFIVSIIVFVYYIYLLVTTAQSPTRQGLHDRYANTVVAKVA